MFTPISHEGNRYSFGSICFDTPVNTVHITYQKKGGGFDSAYPVTVLADGKAVGVGALSEWKGKTPAVFAIDPLLGRHEIEILSPRPELLSVSFDDRGIQTETAPECPDPDDIGAPFYEATDMLGRAVASAEETRGARERQVGIFYWTWRDAHAHMRTLSVSGVLADYPAAEYQRSHPAWGEGPFHPHWNEPLFGYYRNDDPYIIRRHAAMLATAGVDFLLFDCTNGAFLWRDAYEALLAGLRAALLDGIKVPKIAFMLNFGPIETTATMLRALYQELYLPGRYRELWYMLDGKPMIMAYPEALPEEGVCESDTKILKEIKEFFTFRRGQPLYEGGENPAFTPAWGWLENYPQNRYHLREDGGCEMMPVGVAQNSSPHRLCTYFNDKDTFGRSYTAKDGHTRLTSDSYLYGYNFAEQWERAIEIDPDIVFVTGFNEWIMGQYKEPWVTDPHSTQLAMVDQFDREHSRDIEPDKDGYLDTYYLRLCHFIRRYKGSRPRPTASAPVHIDIHGDLSAFDAVSPTFLSHRGTEAKRDWDGFAGYHYVNQTGRNNIIKAKVARDDETLWFYVECASPITEPSETGWMNLLLSVGGEGYEGYDYLINRNAPQNGKVSIARHVKGEGFAWVTVGQGDVRVQDRRMVIAVPRAMIGLAGKDVLDLRFKWCDNTLLGDTPDLMSLYTDGDTAPLGRFSFRYVTEKPYRCPPRP